MLHQPLTPSHSPTSPQQAKMQAFITVAALLPAVLGQAGYAPYHSPAPVYHAPAPAYHAPAPAYHAPAPVYPDEPQPYSFEYGVHDDYTGANFNAGETADGAGNVEGSCSVALPDGRTQHVTYHADDYNGYVADVTYEGEAHFDEVPYHAPQPVYHAPAPPQYAQAPTYHHG